MRRLIAAWVVLVVVAGGIATAAVAGFTDVDEDRFFAGAVAWAAENKITTGRTTTEFAPDANVTRGESVTFLKRYHDAFGSQAQTQGATGPQGPAGASGPQGPAGASATSDVIGVVRFGVSTVGCATDEYRVIVAQSKGTPPPFTSGPCNPINLHDNRVSAASATWSARIAVTNADSLSLVGVHWTPSRLDGSYVDLTGTRFQLGCIVTGDPSSLDLIDDIPQAGDTLLVSCSIVLRSTPSDPTAVYPTVGGATIFQAATSALSSGQLVSAPLSFSETAVLPDTPPISTTTTTTSVP